MRSIFSFLSLWLVAGCANTDLPSHMQEHFARGTLAQTAVINGDLEQARSEARWLVEHRPGQLPEAGVARVRAAAQKVVEAGTIEQAAAGVGAIGASCGSCHNEMGVDPAVVSRVDMRFGTTLPARMARHQWAADRMWEGLINPADDSWIRGAETLMEAPLGREDMPGFGGARAAQLGQGVHRMANEARSIMNQDARATLFGDLLATCARCHESFR